MPTGPKGERRPADVIGNAITIAKIATGEIEDTPEQTVSPAATLGKRGGKARAEKLTPERRAEIAKKAAEKRWRKPAGQS
ncbi:MAG: RNA-binding protein [Methylacidiphilales bacterium]|nr:RNA-binding protein [Candidatus Methylacidiphilales bacterium]